jgi:inner membrane protein
LDPLTHSLFGAALAASPLGRALERPPARDGATPAHPGDRETPTAGVGASVGRPDVERASGLAVWWLVVAANIPDIDAFVYPLSTDLSLLCRRGVTHGVLAQALWPLLLAGLWWWRRRREGSAPRFLPALLVLALGVISHPALDWLNTYGVRLLMPWSGRWFYGDALFIVDPWVWLGLAGGLFLAAPATPGSHARWLALFILLSTAVLAPPRPLPAYVPPAWALCLLLLAGLRVATLRYGWQRHWLAPRRVGVALFVGFVLYAAAMVTASRLGRAEAAEELTARLLRDDLAAGAIYVGPRLAEPQRWDVVMTTDGVHQLGTLDWTAAPGHRLTLDGHPLALPDPSHPAIRAAMTSPELVGLANWLRLPHATAERTRDGWTVWILDLRYARLPADTFGAVRVDLAADFTLRTVHHGR